MSGYHISSSNKVVRCTATKKPCPKQNFATLKLAEAALRAQSTGDLTLRATELVPPVFGDNVTYHSGVDYEYDYYGADYNGYNYYDNSEDGYYNSYSYSVYEGLRLESVDAYAFVRGVFAFPNGTPLPVDLERMIEENDWNEKWAWDVVAEDDYYGQTVRIVPPAGMEEKLLAWYWDLPNADDNSGVLRYVRGKGLDTKGLNPVEAIKKQLAEENDNIQHPLLDKVNAVASLNMKVSEITIPNKEWFDKVEPRPVEARGDSYPVSGVVVSRGGRYILIDGYHRVKGLVEASKKSRNAPYSNFIVLHENKNL